MKAFIIFTGKSPQGHRRTWTGQCLLVLFSLILLWNFGFFTYSLLLIQSLSPRTATWSARTRAPPRSAAWSARARLPPQSTPCSASARSLLHSQGQRRAQSPLRHLMASLLLQGTLRLIGISSYLLRTASPGAPRGGWLTHPRAPQNQLMSGTWKRFGKEESHVLFSPFRGCFHGLNHLQNTYFCDPQRKTATTKHGRPVQPLPAE